MQYPAQIPDKAGAGLRHQHYKEVLETAPAVPWFEVHSENYFGEGGLPHFYLEQIAAQYPLSFHGVGLSIGSAEPIDKQHLQKLRALIDIYQPALVSEHLSFSALDGRHFNDLLPIPYTEESLVNFSGKVSEIQDFLGRQILIENPSSYLTYIDSTIPEWNFYAALPKETGCGLLLDVNNVFVNCENHGYDSADYLAAINPSDVQEYHLAGHTRKTHEDKDLIIDDHGSTVHDTVWQLFEQTVAKIGVRPTLVEWDTRVPALSVLLGEVSKAQAKLDRAC